jgi:hypothetical protein
LKKIQYFEHKITESEYEKLAEKFPTIIFHKKNKEDKQLLWGIDGI